MDAAAHRHELMTDTARSIAELSEADKARGAQHTVEKETGPSLSTETRGLGSRSISVRGGRRHSPVKLPPENSAAQNDMDNGGDRTDMMSDSQGRSAESGNVDVHDDGAEGAHNSTEEMLFMSGDELKGTMLNACNALRALRNVLGASRLSLSEAGSSATDGSGGRRRSAPPTADKMPWPISMLYGSQLYVSDGERGDTHAGEPVMEWPVDLSLVDSVAQLLVATSAFNAIQTVSSERLETFPCRGIFVG